MDLTKARSLLSKINIEYCDISAFIKDKKVDVITNGIAEDQYISMQDLQNAFGISRYHLVKYLKAIGADPIGERKNYIGGKRTRGVGKVVYSKSVLDQVRQYLSTQSDIDAIRQMAKAILES